MKTPATITIVHGNLVLISSTHRNHRLEEYGCYIPHREFREFHDVDCLEDVNHLIDERAGLIQCLELTSENECEDDDICYWFQKSLQLR